MTDRPLFRRTLEGFAPFNDMAQDLAARTKLGEIVSLDAKKVRNGQYHKLFWAMLKLISDNSNPHISTKAALHFAKLAAGVGEAVTDSRGETHFIPGSISFAKMDQTAFETFVQTAIPPLVGRFMAGTAPQDVINEAMALAA
ncbi:DUF1367 family protein [Croceicoccus sp. Ery15]|uniref:DUF1367 family protein n=1 Tax=Croceicoccus sp. Ery15 TaxID=1703338 RepID=UPI001E490BAA|nr:DUF1367 family protein [Croceicoccus sp. Ery15]